LEETTAWIATCGDENTGLSHADVVILIVQLLGVVQQRFIEPEVFSQ